MFLVYLSQLLVYIQMEALNYNSKFNCNFVRDLFWHIILSILLMSEAVFTKVSEVKSALQNSNFQTR